MLYTSTLSWQLLRHLLHLRVARLFRSGFYISSSILQFKSRIYEKPSFVLKFISISIILYYFVVLSIISISLYYCPLYQKPSILENYIYFECLRFWYYTRRMPCLHILMLLPYTFTEMIFEWKYLLVYNNARRSYCFHIYYSCHHSLIQRHSSLSL